MVKQNFGTVYLLYRDACYLIHYCPDTELTVKPASFMQGLGCTLINNSLVAYAIVGRIPVTIGAPYLYPIVHIYNQNEQQNYEIDLRDN